MEQSVFSLVITRKCVTVKKCDKTHLANVKKASANGLLKGLNAGKNPSKTYDFNAKATRGEVALMLYNLLQLK